MQVLRRIADNRVPGSWANRLREERFRLFESLLATVPKPVRILDVGGTPTFWQMRGYVGRADVEVVIVNIEDQEGGGSNLTVAVGDAVDLAGFADGEFDVVFSNSVIEHLETLPRQRRMADEVRRVGHRYFVQTPNRYFPLEPHFLVPGFQFLPIRTRVWLLRRMGLGWYAKTPDRAAAEAEVRSVRLMSARELRTMFPGCQLVTERVFGLPKSFVVHGGWGDTGKDMPAQDRP